VPTSIKEAGTLPFVGHAARGARRSWGTHASRWVSASPCVSRALARGFSEKVGVHDHVHRVGGEWGATKGEHRHGNRASGGIVWDVEGGPSGAFAPSPGLAGFDHHSSRVPKHHGGLARAEKLQSTCRELQTIEGFSRGFMGENARVLLDRRLFEGAFVAGANP
jgi:hypothetical protein